MRSNELLDPVSIVPRSAQCAAAAGHITVHLELFEAMMNAT
jgi:hypothetical protein